MKTNLITPEDFTRINNDINGNPSYVCHFFNLLTYSEEVGGIIEKIKGNSSTINVTLDAKYKAACKRANTIGGKKYHTKSYGGGIVFQSYNIQDLCNTINELVK